MQSDASRWTDTDAAPDMLAMLRSATGPAHRRLDAAFGSLKLGRQADLTRFLAAHAIALAPLAAGFRRFVEHELALPCPDYPAMVSQDLASLGTAAADLPALTAPEDLALPGAAAGIAYVLCGSRLGMAVIRKDGYWGRELGFRSRYMEDELGHQCWKALIPWLRSREMLPDACGPVQSAALASFAAFERAFGASAAALPRSNARAELAAHG